MLLCSVGSPVAQAIAVNDKGTVLRAPAQQNRPLFRQVKPKSNLARQLH